MDGAAFARWICHFSNAVYIDVQRLLILVHDRCSSHFNGEIVREAVRLKIILVLLLANASHPLRTVDVGVLKPLRPASMP